MFLSGGGRRRSHCGGGLSLRSHVDGVNGRSVLGPDPVLVGWDEAGNGDISKVSDGVCDSVVCIWFSSGNCHELSDGVERLRLFLRYQGPLLLSLRWIRCRGTSEIG